MGLQVKDMVIKEVKVISQFHAADQRGDFVKTFHQSALAALGIDFELKESFYSHSIKNVIRGMHFHAPPYEHDKIVFCTHGAILDIALDLRKHSETYGQYVSQELSADNHKALYIPKGFAHGFLSLTDLSTAFYLVSGEYNAQADGGVRYDSFGFDWGVEAPILSERDLSFVTLTQFNSPF